MLGITINLLMLSNCKVNKYECTIDQDLVHTDA